MKDKEIKRQKEEFHRNERIIEQEKEGQQKELINRIMKLQKAIMLEGADNYDRKPSRKTQRQKECVPI